MPFALASGWGDVGRGWEKGGGGWLKKEESGVKWGIERD